MEGISPPEVSVAGEVFSCSLGTTSVHSKDAGHRSPQKHHTAGRLPARDAEWRTVFVRGLIAQLVERRVRNAKAGSSNLPGSTSHPAREQKRLSAA